MNLDASEIRAEAMPAANRGASDDDLDRYLYEWETEVTRRLGELPEDDTFMRGILRDLAAAQGMTKIARTDEDYQAARELRDEALERLGAYPSAAPDSYGREIHSVPLTSNFDYDSTAEPWNASWEPWMDVPGASEHQRLP